MGNSVQLDLTVMEVSPAFELLCLNCHEMMAGDQVEAHSTVCTEVTEQVTFAEQHPELHIEIDFKLRKLTDVLHRRVWECQHKGHVAEASISFLHYMLKVSQDATALHVYDHSSLSTLLSLLSNLKTTTRLFVSSKTPRMWMYAARLAILLKDKASLCSATQASPMTIAAEGNQLTSFSTASLSQHNTVSRNSKHTDTSSLKDDIQFTMPRGSKGQLEDDCVSASGASDITRASSIASFTTDYRMIPDGLSEYGSAKTDFESDQQRYFYSQCFAVKLSFESTHPAQYISVPQLYQTVKQRQIPPEQWPKFIYGELERASLKAMSSS
eukprot:GILJ01004833.1.p1 GENE.GILJ01004833.1~~GILJ01004833.1.p1  ORF type:complete len:326 (+),score=29.88 GILJ01004833.1:2-979(+)